MTAEAGHHASRTYRDRDGDIHLNGGQFFNDAEVDVAPQLETVTGGVAAGYKIARGQHTTIDADDTVVTGLATVIAVIAGFNDAPVEAAKFVSADIGDQAGAPAAGSFLLKTWKDTDADAAPVAATTFSIKVNWIAIGT